MKICAPATSRPGIDLNMLDEIDLTYTERHSLEDLVAFCKDYIGKEINIVIKDCFPEISSLEMLNSLLDDKLFIKLPFTLDGYNFSEKLQENNIKYYFNYPIDSYIKLRWIFEKTKATDIYISDDLCYNLEEVSKMCHDNGVSIRMVLNRIPSSFPFAGELYDAPIFSPQNFKTLSLYIDTAEFDCWDGDRYLWNKFEIQYRRWFKDNKWNKQLNYLNNDVMMDFPNYFINPDLMNSRIKCKHRCMTNVSSPCSKCNRYIQQAQYINNKLLKDPE